MREFVMGRRVHAVVRCGVNGDSAAEGGLGEPTPILMVILNALLHFSRPLGLPFSLRPFPRIPEDIFAVMSPEQQKCAT